MWVVGVVVGAPVGSQDLSLGQELDSGVSYVETDVEPPGFEGIAGGDQEFAPGGENLVPSWITITELEGEDPLSFVLEGGDVGVIRVLLRQLVADDLREVGGLTSRPTSIEPMALTIRTPCTSSFRRVATSSWSRNCTWNR